MFAKRIQILLTSFALIVSMQSPVNTGAPRAQTKRMNLTMRRFDFGPGKVAPGYTQVLQSTVYNRDVGYGFEPESRVSCFDRGSKDALRSDLCTSDQPFFFSVALPEGNYNVTITFGD